MATILAIVGGLFKLDSVVEAATILAGVSLPYCKTICELCISNFKFRYIFPVANVVVGAGHARDLSCQSWAWPAPTT